MAMRIKTIDEKLTVLDRAYLHIIKYILNNPSEFSNDLLNLVHTNRHYIRDLIINDKVLIETNTQLIPTNSYSLPIVKQQIENEYDEPDEQFIEDNEQQPQVAQPDLQLENLHPDLASLLDNKPKELSQLQKDVLAKFSKK